MSLGGTSDIFLEGDAIYKKVAEVDGEASTPEPEMSSERYYLGCRAAPLLVGSYGIN